MAIITSMYKKVLRPKKRNLVSYKEVTGYLEMSLVRTFIW